MVEKNRAKDNPTFSPFIVGANIVKHNNKIKKIHYICTVIQKNCILTNCVM